MSEDDISLTELLNDDDVEFVIYKDGEEIKRKEEYGEALSAVLEATGLEVGVEEDVGAGMSRSVYLDPEGVLQTLLLKEE